MNYYFGDNRSYSSEDLKNALGVLVAKGGISVDLSDGVEYDVSKLNELIGSAVAAGVVGEKSDSLKLTYTDGAYVISPGKAVFSDGGIVEVEEETEVSVSSGQYFYIAYSEMLDDVYFYASDTEQSEGSGVLLIPIGFVQSDKSVNDMRSFAQGKIPALASATWNTLREAEFSIDTSSLKSSGGYIEVTHEIDGDINFMLYNASNLMATMDLSSDEATYNYIYRTSSSNHGRGSEYFCVGISSHGLYRATYIDCGTGYITLRYYFPNSVSGDEYTYTALIGIKTN